MNNKNLFIILISIILISSFLIGYFIIKQFTIPISTNIVEVEVEVKEGSIGFNTDTDKLYFGKIEPGASSHRELTISNRYKFKTKIIYYYLSNNESNINNWIFTNPLNGVTIKPEENVTFKIMLSVPEKISEGNYSGEILFSTYRAKPWENKITHYKKLSGCFNEGDFWDIISCKN